MFGLGRKDGNRKNGKKKKVVFYDYTLFFLTVFMVCFGLVMLYSVSSYDAATNYGDAAYFLKKQLRYDVVGVVVMIIASLMPMKFYKFIAVPAYWVSLICCLLIFTPLGVSYNNSRRWLNLGIEFQPSELMKVGIMLMLAYMISRRPNVMQQFKNVIIIMIEIVMIPFGAIAVTNASTAIIVLVIGAAIVFVANRKIWPFLVAGGFAVAALAGYLIYGAAYRKGRIDTWLHPENADDAYQTIQGLYAIGSGGIFGKGLGNSMTKLGALPEVQNDMIFSAICEELGVFGAICLAVLYLLMIWKFIIIAVNAKEQFGMYLATGVMAHIAVQALLHIAVVTNTIPNTGVTLPFFSYGGTSAVIMLGEVGMVLAVSRTINVNIEEPEVPDE